MPHMITGAAARAIAYDWASVMTWNDPGVALYGFASTGRVQSEAHRADCATYVRRRLEWVATDKRRGATTAGRRLRALLRYILNTPVEG